MRKAEAAHGGRLGSRTAPTGPVMPKRPDLSPHEWDFAPVTDDELAVCRLWEYARESTSILRIWGQTSSIASDRTAAKEKRDAIRKEFYGLFNALGRACILFQDGVYGFGGTKPCEGFKSPFPEPWQALTADQRRVLKETAEWEVRDISPEPGFRRAGCPELSALVKLFRPKSLEEVFGGDGRIAVADFDHAGSKLRAICPNLIDADGTETLLVEIEWGEFTNEQLVKDFAQWLKENDPPGISRPDKRGHKLRDLRVGLERLGMMRLLSRFTLREMPLKCPPAWQAFGNRDWYKERKKAEQTFHELLPFLPAGEEPASLRTKGRRNK